MLIVILAFLFQYQNPCEAFPRKLNNTQMRICADIHDTAHSKGVDPLLAVSVGYHETRFRYKIGAAGEIGPMQAIPRYWCPETGTCDSVDAGVDALRYMLRRYGDTRLALTRYNGAGESARRYAGRVLRIRSEVLSASVPAYRLLF